MSKEFCHEHNEVFDCSADYYKTYIECGMCPPCRTDYYIKKCADLLNTLEREIADITKELVELKAMAILGR